MDGNQRISIIFYLLNLLFQLLLKENISEINEN